MKKTRFIPYGYTVRNGKTVIEHAEADIIKEIFEQYVNGESLKDIAESLTARRIPYTEKTDVWDKARIARIIDNAKYMYAISPPCSYRCPAMRYLQSGFHPNREKTVSKNAAAGISFGRYIFSDSFEQ